MWRAIFFKELAEVFSDSRTRLNVIVGPLVITPLLLAMIGGVVRNQAIEDKKRSVTVGVIGLDSAPAVAAALRGGPAAGIKFTPVRDITEAERQIRRRILPVALAIAPDANEHLKANRSARLTIVSDAGSESSGQAADRLREYIRLKGDTTTQRRLAANGMSLETARPFLIQERELKGSSRSMLLLTMFLPYLLALSAVMGGLMAASNAVAGEKERGTLETLLVTPVSRRDIAIGKFATVTVTSVLSCTLSLVGMLWPFYVKLPMFAWLASEGLALKPATILALVLVQLPLSIFASGVLLALSTYARNQKEMQGYSVPVMLFGTVGAMLSVILKADGPLFWAVVPVTNAALVLKQALQGITDPPFIAIACTTSLVYAGIAVAVAAHLFRQESVLTRF